MRDYKTHEQFSKRMSDDQALARLIRQLVAQEPIGGVIETGTFDGQGSTRLLAEAYRGLTPPKFFYTCELNLKNYRSARKNLEPYPFVECLWGRSVKVKDAVDFIRKDTMLNQHELYPDVFIDGKEDPVAFYTHECKSGTLSSRQALRNFFNPFYYWMRLTHFKGEDLLSRLLTKHQDDAPLIVLDSAGGIGLLEFQIMQRIMKGKRYWLLLDDIAHLKHIRSFEHVRTNPDYELLACDVYRGWALASSGAKGKMPIPSLSSTAVSAKTAL